MSNCWLITTSPENFQGWYSDFRVFCSGKGIESLDWVSGNSDGVAGIWTEGKW